MLQIQRQRYNLIYRLMQQLEDIGNAPRRELTHEDDLEQQLDRDEVGDNRNLKMKVVFSIQCLGGVRTIERQGKQLDAYIKGPHCEESVRDLVKFIRNEGAFNPKTRLILAQFNILESDLLKLLPLQVEDKKLSFWIIALLALMTEKPSEELNPQESALLSKSLRQYKQSFTDSECLKILMVHISDFYSIPKEDRKKAHIQMQEFIITLLRNIVQIPQKVEENPRLNNYFIAEMIKEDIMIPVFYILQNDQEFSQKMSVTILEIFYHFYTSFDPEVIYAKKQESKITKLLASRKKVELPTRHSRFQPTFMKKDARGVFRVTHSIKDTEKQQNFKGQRKVPVRQTDYKKVIPLDGQKFGSDFMSIHFEKEGKEEKLHSLGQIVRESIQEFLQVEFQIIVKITFNDIFRQSARITDQNVIQYMLLCSWALQTVRARYHKERFDAASEQQRSQVKFPLEWIVQVMQNAHFELIYKILFQEATRQKRKQFKINQFNAGIKLFNSYLDVVEDISHSMNMADRKNANVLMANIFRHDIARIFRQGLQLITHQGILSNIIKVIHKFFKLLSTYSDGKVLVMQTNKLLKRKKKRNYSSDQGERIRENDDDSEEQPERQRNREEQGRFQERKYNEKSEFAVLAEYSIISKYLNFLKNEKFLTNEDNLNEAIFFYLFQIKKLLQGEWLFFQAQTLSVFQLILANREWANKNKQKSKFIQGVCLSFIKLLKKNPLALVESLFRYNSLSLKDQILKNYAQDYEEVEEPQQNLFTDE